MTSKTAHLRALALGGTLAACSSSTHATSPGDAGRRDAGPSADGSAPRDSSGSRGTTSGASARSESAEAGRSSSSEERSSTSSQASQTSRPSQSATASSSRTPEPDAGFDAGPCVRSDAGALPPSCAPGGAGMTNCGRCDESCCASLEVPSGTFDRTYDLTDAGDPAPPPNGNPTGEADPATVSGLRLDKYLVTVGRFRQFVKAWNGGAGYLPPPGSGKHSHLRGGKGLTDSASTSGAFEPGWVATDDADVSPTDGSAGLGCFPGLATWTSVPAANENLPINCVTWQEAYAFCIFDGGFLPSEAEWEYAAAGGSEQREYPWGKAAPDTQYAIFGCDYPDGTGTCTGFVNIANVGASARGAGRWGQLDLAGELYEWTLDWYARYGSPCTDCARVTVGSNRVIRGGDFAFDATYLLPANRGDYLPARGYGVGFRCARTP